MKHFRVYIAFACAFAFLAPGTALAASPSTEAYFGESAQILGQLFAPKMHIATKIHSHAELGSRHASLMRNQCDASGRYQFYFNRDNLYLLQVWKGKKEINRTMEIVKEADAKSFRLLSAAYGMDKDRIYAIERFENDGGRCRYRVVPLEQADRESFKIHGGKKFMAADENGRYWFGEQI